MSDAPSYSFGTTRACDPQETFARLAPCFERVGITRVADITRLDVLGVPTWQAIRPLARSLSVSQGKGLTPAAAKASAVMESIELWHSEFAEPPARLASVGEVEREIGYPVNSLQLHDRPFLHPGLAVDWLEARTLVGGRPTLVPRDLVIRDRRQRRRWTAPVFRGSSNGLAGGNTPDEAKVHALCELIERDATERARRSEAARRRPIALETVDFQPCRDFAQRCAEKGFLFELFDLTGPIGIPVIYASLWTREQPVYFMGWGCHPDRDIAVARAFTEAAQSRLTVIAGARDDIEPIYHWTISHPQRRARKEGAIDYAELPTWRIRSFEEAVRMLSGQVERVTGHEPVFVDFTRDDIGVPVVHVVAPGLQAHRRSGP